MKYLIILSFTISFNFMSAQNIKSHQWKNRVVLIVSKTDSSKSLKKQLDYFKNNENEFKERKLITYQILPNRYLLSAKGELNNWIEDKTLYKEFMTLEDEFKIVLIGLDGNKKHTQNTPIYTKELYRIIDAMPMRRSEIRKN